MGSKENDLDNWWYCVNIKEHVIQVGLFLLFLCYVLRIAHMCLTIFMPGMSQWNGARVWKKYRDIKNTKSPHKVTGQVIELMTSRLTHRDSYETVFNEHYAGPPNS